MKPWPTLMICMAACLLGGLPAYGTAPVNCLPFGPNLAENGWQEARYPGKKPAVFRVLGNYALAITTDRSVSILHRNVSIEAEDTVSLSWNWLVEQQVPPTDLDRRGADDRSLAIHLVFASATHQGIRNGRPSGHVITYVWGGNGAQGDRFANPYFGKDSIQIILRNASAPVGLSFLERIDFAQDYRSAFGGDPLPLYMIGISADSDDTKTASFGEIHNLCFARVDYTPEEKRS